MAKNTWQNNRWGESGEDYSGQYNDERPDYTWLKQLIVAAIIFALVYCAHSSDTTLGAMVDNEVRYSLSFQTDWNHVLEQVASHAPEMMDLSVLKKVQMAVTKPADPLLYMTKPIRGKIISPFGWRVHPISKQEGMHDGIDIEAILGTSVKAAAAGKVKMIAQSAQYGKTLIVEHSQDVDTLYGHLGEIVVNQGELISQGQVIGKVGKTGMVSGPLLYFEVREKGKAIDPVPRLKGDFPAEEGK
jgi:murein DD-endopeptidase MepM/ murein hydrolase activator NlpD